MKVPTESPIMHWRDTSKLIPYRYKCGYCGANIGSDIGYMWKDMKNPQKILICIYCQKPTFFVHEYKQYPSSPWGKSIEGITDHKIKNLYDEARNCMALNSFTASVLCCRKLIMNIAVQKGAKQGENFLFYVEYLSDKNYVPPDGKEWVDHIRKRGNEANHEILLMEKEDAEELLSFMEMLLIFIYDFPSRISKKKI